MSTVLVPPVPPAPVLAKNQRPALNFLWIVCAWCKQEFATKPCAPAMHGEISHGVCPACKAGLLRQAA